MVIHFIHLRVTLYRRLSLHGVVIWFLIYFSFMNGISKALDVTFDLSPHANPNDQRIFLLIFGCF